MQIIVIIIMIGIKKGTSSCMGQINLCTDYLFILCHWRRRELTKPPKSHQTYYLSTIRILSFFIRQSFTVCCKSKSNNNNNHNENVDDDDHDDDNNIIIFNVCGKQTSPFYLFILCTTSSWFPQIFNHFNIISRRVNVVAVRNSVLQ